MKVVISACVFIAVAALAYAAPAPSSQEEAPTLRIHEDQELFRGKRSHYGQQAVQYYSPCSGGAGPIPAIAPSSYHHAQIPAYHAPQHYAPAHYASQGYGYGYPQYREMEDELAFSDMEPMMSEHIPMSRFAYASPAGGHYGGAGLGVLQGGSGGLQAGLGGLQTTAPAFGVFPNAHPGGCAVPLLLSCSPSIVPGRLVNAHPAGSYGGSAGSYGGESYRSDEATHEEESHLHEQQAHSDSAHANANANTHQ